MSVAVTKAEWTFERGGTLLCGKPERPDGDHYFVETSNDSAVEYPGHPAARRGVAGWLLCHHCDAWAEYDYGDGINTAVADALGIDEAPDSSDGDDDETEGAP